MNTVPKIVNQAVHTLSRAYQESLAPANPAAYKGEWDVGQNITPTPGYSINQLLPLIGFLLIMGGIVVIIGVCSFCGRKGDSNVPGEFPLVQRNVEGPKIVKWGSISDENGRV